MPPAICEVPHWDRTPAIPSQEEVENANDSDTDDEIPQARRGSSGTSLEQATKWVRRLSI